MKKIVITGAAGFIGSNLVDRLIHEGYFIYGVDNLITGSLRNLSHLNSNNSFDFVEHDVTKFIKINSHSKNIFTELLLLFRVSKIVKEYKPNLILSYTIKPNIYSLILNKFYSFHTIINITGLGNVFKTLL